MNQKDTQRLTKELRERLVAFGGVETMRDMEALVKELVPFIAGECDTAFNEGTDYESRKHLDPRDG